MALNDIEKTFKVILISRKSWTVKEKLTVERRVGLQGTAESRSIVYSAITMCNKKDGCRQQNVRQRQKLISIIDYDVYILEYLQPFSRFSTDLEIWVWGPSRSLKKARFDRPCITFY